MNYRYDKKNRFYSAKPKDDPKDRIEIEVGDSKDPGKFQPQVKIMRWDNEVNASFRLLDDEPKQLFTEGEKIKLVGTKKEVHFYEKIINKTSWFVYASVNKQRMTDYPGVTRIIDDKLVSIVGKKQQIWQSDNLKDRGFYQEEAQKFSGDVLVAGLGLGLFQEYILQNPNVTSVTTIEISQQVIDEYEKYKPTIFNNTKHQVICGDYFDYVKNTQVKYDGIFGDIWPFSSISCFLEVKGFREVSKKVLRSEGIIRDRDFLPELESELPKRNENCYEFEVVLKEKPSSNKIEFLIETKGLDFNYQPALTQEEINEGSIRPDEIVGSYAVYHSNCPSNVVGGKKYKTGKAFHIYRPKIIDSAGNWVWGVLNIDVESKRLTVTISQEFLDTAIYPIRHASGLTFGCDPASPGGTSLASGSRIYGSYFLGLAGTATTLSAYTENEGGGAGNADTKCAIYKQSDSSYVIGSGDIYPPASVAWTDYDVTDTVITAQNYWLVWWSESYMYSNNRIYYDATGNGGYQDVTYGSWPASISMTGEDRIYSIYCTYTTAGSASASVSLSPSISPSLSLSLSPSLSVSPSSSPSLSPSVSVSLSVSLSPSPSASPSLSQSLSPSVSTSLSPSVSVSLSPSVSESASISASPSLSPSVSESVSISLSPSVSISLSPSVSVSLSPSISISVSTSLSPSLSVSLSPSVSISLSLSVSESASVSLSPSLSISLSPSVSPSLSPSLSVSLSPSVSISASISLSPSVSTSLSPSVSQSVSVSLSESASPSPSLSVSLSPSLSGSVSISASPSVSPSVSISLSPSLSPSPSASPSVSISLSPSVSTSLSPSISESASVSASPSLSISFSESASPSAGYQQYTKGNYGTLPVNDNDLETAYTSQEVIDVATKDDIRVDQTGIQQNIIHQFKDFVGGAGGCSLECELQSDLAPSSSAVYLQVYNQNSTTWETVDSDNATGANTDFILTAIIADATNYKDAGGLVSCRVYQEAI